MTASFALAWAAARTEATNRLNEEIKGEISFFKELFLPAAIALSIFAEVWHGLRTAGGNTGAKAFFFRVVVVVYATVETAMFVVEAMISLLILVPAVFALIRMGAIYAHGVLQAETPALFIGRAFRALFIIVADMVTRVADFVYGVFNTAFGIDWTGAWTHFLGWLL